MVRFLCLLYFLAGAEAQESLMLRPDEQQAIDQLRPQISAPHKKSIVPALRLDGIVYCDANHWTIWLNGRPYNAGEPWEHGHILSVERRQVILFMDTLQKEVTLTLNQEISVS